LLSRVKLSNAAEAGGICVFTLSLPLPVLTQTIHGKKQNAINSSLTKDLAASYTHLVLRVPAPAFFEYKENLPFSELC
jgi:hypothetical protein